MSYYVHNVPGRLRIKSSVIKRNKDAEYELRKALSTVEGIATVNINLTTGSLLVNYNSKTLKSMDIINLLEQRGYIDKSKIITNDPYLHAAASKAGKIVGKAVFGVFAEKAFEGSALSLLAVLI